LYTFQKKKLVVEFEMKDLDLMHYFLGLEVWQSPKKIFLNQGKYAVEILKRFDMLDCKSMNTPMETKLMLSVDTSSKLIDATLYIQIIGSLMYLTNTRPDICFAVNTLRQFLVLEKDLPPLMQSCREGLTPFPHADLHSLIDKSRDKNKYFSTCTHLASYTSRVYAGCSTIARVHRDLC
jgi:hypothetical protein